MNKKKVNPRRKPATMADIERAKHQAKDAGIRVAMAIMFTVLADKHEFDVDKMREVWNQTENLADSIGEGRVTVADLCCTLREEYDIKIL